jgi:putative FmdB family regulatory protein
MLTTMAFYEYLCLACEHHFEERRPMGASVDVALACPSCGADRVRRRFSFATTAGATAAAPITSAPAGSGGCCGGGCACGN